MINFLAYFEGEIPICLNVQFSSPGLRRRVKYVTNLAHERNQLIEIHRFCNFLRILKTWNLHTFVFVT